MHHTSGTKTQILTFIPKPLSGRNKKGTEGPPCAVGIPRSCPPRPRATVPGCMTAAAREPWRPTRLLIAMATDHASVANPLACLPFGAHVFHRLSTGLQCPRWQLPFAWRPLPCKWQSACTGFPGCGHRREDTRRAHILRDLASGATKSGGGCTVTPAPPTGIAAIAGTKRSRP